MRRIRLLTKTKLTTGVIVAIGLVASTITFAAIPNSSTGQVEACRTILTGAIRIIDSQAGQTCTILESGLLWPSAPAPKVAHIYFSDDNGTLDTSKTSPSILSVNMSADSNGSKTVCIHTSFTPKTGFSSSGGSSGYQSLFLKSGSYDDVNNINAMCGSGYEAMATYQSNFSLITYTLAE